MSAIELQQATYFSKSVEQPMFVRWIKNPVATSVAYWRQGFRVAVWAGTVCFLIMLCATFVAAVMLANVDKSSESIP